MPLLPSAVGALILVTSLFNFLHYNDYPIVAPEVGIIVAGLIAVAVAVGLLYRLIGDVGRPLLDVLLVYLALDLNFDGIGVAVAAVAAILLLRRLLIPVLGVVFVVAFATEVISLGLGSASVQAHGGSASAVRSDAPALVHLILDEHIGIDGLPDDFPEAVSMREELQDFYSTNGFRLFGGAYSEHRHTVNAIPHILNFGAELPWNPEHKNGMKLGTNAYFDNLRALGYEVRVYQTEFLDYCSSQTVRSCRVYRSADIGPIATSPLSVGEKASIVVHAFWSLSEAVTGTASAYDWAARLLTPRDQEPLLIELDRHRRVSTMSALEAFDGLIADLRQARPGEAYFAHILLPHYPYATNRDCTIKGTRDWQVRSSTRESRRTRQLGYFDQLSCATSKLGAALEALAASPGGKRSIVVVHGDHGSRITEWDPRVENAGLFDELDLISSYSTLFAVRAPGIEPGYDDVRLSVAQLLPALARSGYRSAEVDPRPASAPSVFLDDFDWKPVRRVDLPRSWAQR